MLGESGGGWFNREMIRRIIRSLGCWLPLSYAICAMGQQTSGVVANSNIDTNLPHRCAGNLKQIYLDYANWAERHGGKFPFNVSTNAGGSKELSSLRDDRLEKNTVEQFRHLAIDMVPYEAGAFTLPKIFVCPADTNRLPATNVLTFNSSNVTYELFCPTNVLRDLPPGVLLHCPIHDWTTFTDGSIYKVN
jgi:hypothetical protein